MKTSISISDATKKQLASLKALTGMQMGTIITTAVDRYYREELMDKIRIKYATDDWDKAAIDTGLWDVARSEENFAVVVKADLALDYPNAEITVFGDWYMVPGVNQYNCKVTVNGKETEDAAHIQRRVHALRKNFSDWGVATAKYFDGLPTD
jgi:hypothetical protein